MDCNQANICGKITDLGILRYTPADTPVITFDVNHVSNQVEAGLSRKVVCNISAIALAQTAIDISKMKIGCVVKLTGFFANKSRMSQQLVLHVNNVVKL